MNSASCSATTQAREIHTRPRRVDTRSQTPGGDSHFGADSRLASPLGYGDWKTCSTKRRNGQLDRLRRRGGAFAAYFIYLTLGEGKIDRPLFLPIRSSCIRPNKSTRSSCRSLGCRR